VVRGRPSILIGECLIRVDDVVASLPVVERGSTCCQMSDSAFPGRDTKSTPAGPAHESQPFERVLVPIDFSPKSKAAFLMAMRVVAPWGSEVILFNAPGMDDGDGFLQSMGAPWGKSDLIEQAREHLRSFADTVLPGSGRRVRAEAARDEDLVASIARACERLRPSLLVLGLNARRRERWLRSRAERIVRAVDCPVLTVPAAHPDGAGR
jgi:nucleotide-binding universal stress UspA family protein